jgi:hypothetical protein
MSELGGMAGLRGKSVALARRPWDAAAPPGLVYQSKCLCVLFNLRRRCLQRVGVRVAVHSRRRYSRRGVHGTRLPALHANCPVGRCLCCLIAVLYNGGVYRVWGACGDAHSRRVVSQAASIRRGCLSTCSPQSVVVLCGCRVQGKIFHAYHVYQRVFQPGGRYSQTRRPHSARSALTAAANYLLETSH